MNSAWEYLEMLCICGMVFDINDANIVDCPTNGAWTASNEANRFTYNAGSDTYTKTITPTTSMAEPQL
jgi:hypothetical protein